LPFYDDLRLKKVDGVNWIFPLVQFTPHTTKCCYSIDNPNFNPDLPEDPGTNLKTINCDYLAHYSITHLGVIHGESHYCYQHKKVVLEKNKSDMKIKQKEEKQATRLKLKEANKKLKEELKQQAKIAKLQEMSSVNLDANVVISSVSFDFDNTQKCVEILKTGTRKGSACSLKTLNPQLQLCKRHYNLKNKI